MPPTLLTTRRDLCSGGKASHMGPDRPGRARGDAPRFIRPVRPNGAAIAYIRQPGRCDEASRAGGVISGLSLSPPVAPPQSGGAAKSKCVW